MTAAARAAQVLVRPVDERLVAGVGVDGRHLPVADAERAVQHGGDRRQAVRRAGGVRDDVVRLRVVDVLEVHAEDDVRVDGIGALARGGENDLARACVAVSLGVGPRAELARALQHDVRAEVGPRQRARVAFVQQADLAVADAQHVAVAGDGGREAPVDGIAREQGGERGGVGDVVDGDDLQFGIALVRGAHDAAPDAAEAVDGDAGRHAWCSLSSDRGSSR